MLNTQIDQLATIYMQPLLNIVSFSIPKMFQWFQLPTTPMLPSIIRGVFLCAASGSLYRQPSVQKLFLAAYGRLKFSYLYDDG